jgi:hypothetical protein
MTFRKALALHINCDNFRVLTNSLYYVINGWIFSQPSLMYNVLLSKDLFDMLVSDQSEFLFDVESA